MHKIWVFGRSHHIVITYSLNCHGCNIIFVILLCLMKFEHSSNTKIKNHRTTYQHKIILKIVTKRFKKMSQLRYCIWWKGFNKLNIKRWFILLFFEIAMNITYTIWHILDSLSVIFRWFLYICSDALICFRIQNIN